MVSPLLSPSPPPVLTLPTFASSRSPATVPSITNTFTNPTPCLSQLMKALQACGGIVSARDSASTGETQAVRSGRREIEADVSDTVKSLRLHVQHLEEERAQSLRARAEAEVHSGASFFLLLPPPLPLLHPRLLKCSNNRFHLTLSVPLY